MAEACSFLSRALPHITSKRKDQIKDRISSHVTRSLQNQKNGVQVEANGLLLPLSFWKLRMFGFFLILMFVDSDSTLDSDITRDAHACSRVAPLKAKIFLPLKHQSVSLIQRSLRGFPSRLMRGATGNSAQNLGGGDERSSRTLESNYRSLRRLHARWRRDPRGKKMNPTANLITNNPVCALFPSLHSYF